MFFLFAWSEDKVTEAMILSPHPHLPQVGEEMFLFLRKELSEDI